MRNTIVCVICLLFIGASAQAWDAVNVNFQYSTSGPTETQGGAAFGSGVTMTWNNFINGTATLSNLDDSAGAATAVSVTPNSTNSWSTSFFSSLTYGENIMHDYLYVQNTTRNMTIAGLAAGSTYDLYLYGHGDQEVQNTRFIVNGVSKTTNLSNAGGATALTEGAHYVVFKGVPANAGGQITVNWGNTGNYGALNGLQIVRGNLNTVAKLPAPYNDEYMIDSPTTLSWTNPLPLDGTSSITCTVYLGTDSNRTSMDSVTLAPDEASVQINTTHFPNYGTLQRGIDYDWIVDCVDASPQANPANGLGETWMFHNYLPDQDGFGGQATGGEGGATVTVSNYSDLKYYATSVNPYIIRVSGTIDFGPGVKIQPKSNKTIEGADHNATIIGNIDLSGSQNCDNIIIRNMNITNPYGNDGLTVWGATNVFITHCDIYDCGDGLCDITQSSDNVTVSWCKFYYTNPTAAHRFTMVSGNDPDSHPHITLHHNWWAENCYERMPSGSWNTVHMYNNYFTCTGNYYCSNTRDGGDMLSEYNYYDHVNDPVTVSLPPATGNPAGLIKTVGNTYVSCTGTIYPGTDTVSTPTYTYTTDAAADVPDIIVAGAGTILYGDLNGDKTVDGDDLVIFCGLWLDDNNSLAYYQDLNGDGRVALYEFAAFAQNWQM